MSEFNTNRTGWYQDQDTLDFAYVASDGSCWWWWDDGQTWVSMGRGFFLNHHGPGERLHRTTEEEAVANGVPPFVMAEADNASDALESALSEVVESLRT